MMPEGQISAPSDENVSGTTLDSWFPELERGKTIIKEDSPEVGEGPLSQNSADREATLRKVLDTILETAGAKEYLMEKAGIKEPLQLMLFNDRDLMELMKLDTTGVRFKMVDIINIRRFQYFLSFFGGKLPFDWNELWENELRECMAVSKPEALFGRITGRSPYLKPLLKPVWECLSQGGSLIIAYLFSIFGVLSYGYTFNEGLAKHDTVVKSYSYNTILPWVLIAVVTAFLHDLAFHVKMHHRTTRALIEEIHAARTYVAFYIPTVAIILVFPKVELLQDIAFVDDMPFWFVVAGFTAAACCLLPLPVRISWYSIGQKDVPTVELWVVFYVVVFGAQVATIFFTNGVLRIAMVFLYRKYENR